MTEIRNNLLFHEQTGISLKLFFIFQVFRAKERIDEELGRIEQKEAKKEEKKEEENAKKE